MSLKADPVTKDFRRAKLTVPQALTYVRRVHITTEFVRALRKGLDTALTPEQRKLLKEWETDLATMEQILLFQVLKIQPQMIQFTDVHKDVKEVDVVDVTKADLADLDRRLNMQHCPQCVRNILNQMARQGRLHVLPE